MGVRVLTSKGGTYTAPIPQPPAGYPIVTFNSPLFESVKWIIFFDVGMGAPVGIDKLTLQIPEPGAGMLLPLGLAALVAARRRKSIDGRHLAS